jgi:hypothetical protein
MSQLDEDAVPVILHGAFADHQPLGDLAVAEPSVARRAISLTLGNGPLCGR